MLNIAICEDDPIQSQIILALLEKYQNERPGMEACLYPFDSGGGVLQSVENGQEFNLFLLDILLPGMNGIELAKNLRTKYPDIPLVFLTSSAEYALDAFKVSAAQYILKPVREDELFRVLDNITISMTQKKDSFFMLATPKKTVKIPYGSIICVELAGRMMRFYLSSGENLLSSTIRVSFAKALYPLLQDSRFLYAHKSFVLNMEHIKETGNFSFIMEGGIEVPIPKYNFAKAKSSYFRWLKKHDRSGF